MRIKTLIVWLNIIISQVQKQKHFSYQNESIKKIIYNINKLNLKNIQRKYLKKKSDNYMVLIWFSDQRWFFGVKWTCPFFDQLGFNEEKC